MIWLLWLPVTLAAPRVFPLVDPGLFVISGVKTCGGGGGYCLLGLDCTLDEDFIPDDEAGHHCEGLRSAFTPSAHFVCCRATNRSLYKPPLAFSTGVPTSLSEAVTGRTTAADVLENEIDQVLLKVAQSVDAINNAPEAEATDHQVDDETVELRDSAEDSFEGEDTIGNSDSLSDSAEEGAQQDLSIDEEYSEEASMDEDVKINSPAPLDESSTNNDKPLDNTLTKNPASGLDEFENDEIYTETSTVDNTPSAMNISNDSTSEKIEVLKNSSTLKTDKNADEPKLTPVMKEDKQENTVELNPLSKEDIQTDVKINKSTNSTDVGSNLLETKSSNENLIQNDDDKIIVGGFDSEESGTKSPDLSADIASSKNETNLYSEWVHSNLGESSKPPLEKFSKDRVRPGNLSSNEDFVKQTDSGIEDYDNVSSDVKKENTLLDDALETNSTKVDTTQTANATEEQFVTSTTVSPATQIPDGRPMSAGQVPQGYPGLADPCSRGVSENCSEEVKFIFQNKTICFGSIYALDWVVTSASCALRIFRAGMLNVSITTVKAPEKVQVKTIIVHESYGENAGSSGQEMEANNIGLVQLRSPMVHWAECVPCLPRPGQRISTSNCTAVTPHTLAPCTTPGSCQSARDAGSGPQPQMAVCTGSARMMKDDHGFHYIILPCDMVWEPRLAGSSARGSGAPLFCEGMLAGLETSTGVGMTVYTPVSPYLDWLVRNTRPGLPDQHFNVG